MVLCGRLRREMRVVKRSDMLKGCVFKCILARSGCLCSSRFKVVSLCIFLSKASRCNRRRGNEIMLASFCVAISRSSVMRDV